MRVAAAGGVLQLALALGWSSTQRGTSGPSPNSVAMAAPPLAFEPNRGQAAAAVDFLARGRDYTLFLTGRDAVLVFPGAAVRMHLVGASGVAGVEARAESPLPGKVNYLRGSDPAKWLTGLPTFRRIVYGGVYPGIDLAYYGRDGLFEYDFLLAPRADPSRIAIQLDGARTISLEPSGDLKVALPRGELRHLRPFAYQDFGGVRRPVTARYALEGRRIRLEVGRYDRARPLVIDPQLLFSTYHGGHGIDVVADVAVRGSDSYVTGRADAPDFPTTPGAYASSDPDPADSDAFVSKFDGEGALVYSTYLGGNGFELGFAISVAADQTVLVAGGTLSNDFPTTSDGLQPSDPDVAGRDAFVARLDRDGAGLLYSTYLGGNGNDNGEGIAGEGGKHIYVVGATASTDFPTTPGALQEDDPDPAGFDGFVTKLAVKKKSVLEYSTYLGGTGNEFVTDLALDGKHAHVTGITSSSDFPTTAEAFAPDDPDPQGTDGFLARLDKRGRELDYATYLGGAGFDTAGSVAIAKGRAYVSGGTFATDFPTTPGAFAAVDPDPAGSDAYVLALDRDGSVLVYSTYLGGHGTEANAVIAVDSKGRAVVSGNSSATDFPTTPGAFQVADPDPAGADVFVTMFDRDGAELLYSTFLGAGGHDLAGGIAFGRKGHVYAAGQTTSSDFPTTSGAAQPADPDPGELDGFVTRLDPSRK